MTTGYTIRFYKYLKVKNMGVELFKIIQKSKLPGVIKVEELVDIENHQFLENSSNRKLKVLFSLKI